MHAWVFAEHPGRDEGRGSRPMAAWSVVTLRTTSEECHLFVGVPRDVPNRLGRSRVHVVSQSVRHRRRRWQRMYGDMEFAVLTLSTEEARARRSPGSFPQHSRKFRPGQSPFCPGERCTRSRLAGSVPFACSR